MGLCCKLFTVVLTIIFFLGIIALVLYLIVRPSEVNSHVEAASLAKFDLTNTTLAYNLTVDLSIRNPNKKVSIYYNRILVSASYEGDRFGFDDSQPKFIQGHKNTTVIHPAFAGLQSITSTGGSMTNQYEKEKGEGYFNIEMIVDLKVKYKALRFKTPTTEPKIKCSLRIPAPSSGNKFSRTQCHVNFFWFHSITTIVFYLL